MPQVQVDDLFGRTFRILVPKCNVTTQDLQKGLLTQVRLVEAEHLIFSYGDTILEDGVSVVVPRTGGPHFIVLNATQFHERPYPSCDDGVFNRPRFAEFETALTKESPATPTVAPQPAIDAPMAVDCRIHA
jgi:hypothetical protein